MGLTTFAGKAVDQVFAGGLTRIELGRVELGQIEPATRLRKRVVSYARGLGFQGAASRVKGAQAWDAFQTILGTAKKLGVTFFHCLCDRIGGARQMPSLADLI
jgi:hypothetical protein